MAEIRLSNGMVSIVDPGDVAALSAFGWHSGTRRGGRAVAPHRHVAIGGKKTTEKMHRFLWRAWGLPVTPQIDHRSGNELDNRRENLRAATASQNMANRRGWSKHGYRGVRLSDNTWYASIKVGGKQRYLGSAVSAESAARIYDAWAREIHGEFARLNFAQQEQ